MQSQSHESHLFDLLYKKVPHHEKVPIPLNKDEPFSLFPHCYIHSSEATSGLSKRNSLEKLDSKEIIQIEGEKLC